MGENKAENNETVELLREEIPEQVRSVKRVATVVYGLQAVSFFLGGLTLLIGVVVNHLKNRDARGTWLESHFRWQIRTFWFGLLWSLLGIPVSFVTLGVGMWIVYPALLVWLVYRIAKGWLGLTDGKEMYVNP